MNRYKNLCNNNKNLKEEWIKISPNMAEIYNKYLMKIELESKENKICVDNFIQNISNAYCNKLDNKQYMEIVQKAFNDIHVCISRQSLTYCEKKKIRELLNKIEYDIYSDKIMKNNTEPLPNNIMDNNDVNDNSVFKKIGNENILPENQKKINETNYNKASDELIKFFDESNSLKNAEKKKDDLIIDNEEINIKRESIIKPVVTMEKKSENKNIKKVISQEQVITESETNKNIIQEEIVSEEKPIVSKDTIIVNTRELVCIFFIIIFLLLILYVINERRIMMRI